MRNEYLARGSSTAPKTAHFPDSDWRVNIPRLALASGTINVIRAPLSNGRFGRGLSEVRGFDYRENPPDGRAEVEATMPGNAMARQANMLVHTMLDE